jgi:hypothetical protein
MPAVADRQRGRGTTCPTENTTPVVPQAILQPMLAAALYMIGVLGRTSSRCSANGR